MAHYDIICVRSCMYAIPCFANANPNNSWSFFKDTDTFKQNAQVLGKDRSVRSVVETSIGDIVLMSGQNKISGENN